MVWWSKFIVIQAVILLLLLEVTLRIYNPVAWRVRGNEIVLPVNHVYRFDIGDAKKLDTSTVHTKNSLLGFRGPDPPRDFEERLTVLTIGGSTTESLFLSDGRTWTDALTRRLEPSFPNIWVNNAGIDGYTTFWPPRAAAIVCDKAAPESRGLSDRRQRCGAQPGEHV